MAAPPTKYVESLVVLIPPLAVLVKVPALFADADAQDGVPPHPAGRVERHGHGLEAGGALEAGVAGSLDLGPVLLEPLDGLRIDLLFKVLLVAGNVGSPLVQRFVVVDCDQTPWKGKKLSMKYLLPPSTIY